jgi:hypothetical protein
LIHFELILVQGDKHWFQCFAGREPLFPVTFVKEAVFSPSNNFGAFVKNKVGIGVWIHMQVLYSVPLVFMSVFVLVPAVFIAIAL